MEFFFRLTRYLFFTLFGFPFRSKAVYITFLSLKPGVREGGVAYCRGEGRGKREGILGRNIMQGQARRGGGEESRTAGRNAGEERSEIRV